MASRCQRRPRSSVGDLREGDCPPAVRYIHRVSSPLSVPLQLDDVDEDTTLNVIGELTLPPDYESDAESVLTSDSRSMFNDSAVESDFEPTSPAETVKEDSFNFVEEKMKKKEVRGVGSRSCSCLLLRSPCRVHYLRLTVPVSSV